KIGKEHPGGCYKRRRFSRLWCERTDKKTREKRNVSHKMQLFSAFLRRKRWKTKTRHTGRRKTTAFPSGVRVHRQLYVHLTNARGKCEKTKGRISPWKERRKGRNRRLKEWLSGFSGLCNKVAPSSACNSRKRETHHYTRPRAARGQTVSSPPRTEDCSVFESSSLVSFSLSPCRLRSCFSFPNLLRSGREKVNFSATAGLMAFYEFEVQSSPSSLPFADHA
ncbi:hypothetical protein TGP89_249685, partial [Toxoplasma gondii p89]